ncbi:MAG: hypothetical protein IJH62_01165 [Mogibacterium sp.]|nr:hypothetical protein [Mogibacterium sp.]
MKLDVEKVKLAQARSGQSLTTAEKQLLVRAKQGKKIYPETLHKLSQKLNCDPEYLIVR